jgi:hypothetical protein
MLSVDTPPMGMKIGKSRVGFKLVTLRSRLDEGFWKELDASSRERFYQWLGQTAESTVSALAFLAREYVRAWRWYIPRHYRGIYARKSVLPIPKHITIYNMGGLGDRSSRPEVASSTMASRAD